ncbi:MAG: Cof-type HAD-IIB family hydrolase [Pseudonocardiaceae bacterium]|nr:Cof-type HAD-IIB family hydrolase [Pseudonocardiaceae bacterium]
MERPRLVASDVDGTLLDPTERVTQRTRAVVDRVVAAGIPFVLVTGRPPRWVPRIVAQLGRPGLAVCANGAMIYDAAADRVRHAVTLDPLALRDAADAVRIALPDAKLAVERPGTSAWDRADQQFLAELDYTHPWPGGDSAAAPRDELLGHPATKLLVRQPGVSSDVMARAVTEVLGTALDVTFSTGHGLVEISAKGVTKGSGLALIAKELGIAADDVVAFGDMPNDLSMLHWAGCGVAMANAHPAVLDVADEITAPNSEDGLALVLERWF